MKFNNMLFGNIVFTSHAIEKYRERVLTHKNIEDLSDKQIKKLILRDVSFKNVREIVNFGDEYKFVFTRYNCEFRFKKINNDNWLLMTVIRYKRIMKWEELDYYDLENMTKEEIKNAGIGAAIQVRKNKKLEYEKEHNLC